MARPWNTAPLPPHPAVGAEWRHMFLYGRMRIAAQVTCPHCKTKRWHALSTIRTQLKRRNYNGQCRPCSERLVRAGYYRWVERNGIKRRTKTRVGYIILGPTSVDLADLPLFREMQSHKNNPAILEHRWVMAKHLGRPLLSKECVDHMDGDRSNNNLSNLRIYVRGKNEPGSVGHGTYYHEWQMALARIKQLET